jgi:hypothetical protein
MFDMKNYVFRKQSLVSPEVRQVQLVRQGRGVQCLPMRLEILINKCDTVVFSVAFWNGAFWNGERRKFK